jgi:hypothetical protein
MNKESHSIRVRAERWAAIEKKAWQLSNEAKKIIKPTDIADALLWKGLKDLKIEDIEIAKKTR